MPLGPLRNWLTPPVFNDEETTRQAHLLYRIFRAMGLLALVAGLASLLDSKNDVLLTVVFYSLVLGWIGVLVSVVRAGRTRLAAWACGVIFWLIIAMVTLFFGGMKGQNASTFTVCTLLVGSIVHRQAALWMGLLSSIWCALVAYLEWNQLLPTQLGPYTPINAWAAFTVTILLTSVLVHASLESLQQAHELAQRSAKERDEALRRSIQGQKLELVGSLTSGIAHDLNNLLTVIVGTSEVLRTQLRNDDADTRGVLDDLEGATQRAALMTGQLLAFGRPKRGESEDLNFTEIVVSMVAILPRLLGQNIQVRLDAPEPCWVHASRSGLEQILLNLAVNARDAMPNGGELNLSLKRSSGEIELTVADTGVGMNPETQKRAFEPFFTTKSSGTGLGLATLKQLVEHFSGTIELTSALSQGTQFRLRFAETERKPPSSLREDEPTRVLLRAESLDPLPEEQPTQIHRVGKGTLTKAPGRVLLVEDDVLVRRALTRALTIDGYEVVAVADGDEAISVVEKIEGLVCVVSDIAMPRMDGDALAARLQKTHPELPMVLISGNREPESSILSGLPRTFLAKPVSQESLRDAIRSVLERTS